VASCVKLPIVECYIKMDALIRSKSEAKMFQVPCFSLSRVIQRLLIATGEFGGLIIAVVIGPTLFGEIIGNVGVSVHF
jgi:hypothetical protein